MILSDSLHDAMEKIQLIIDRLKTSQICHKYDVNVRHKGLEFQIDDLVVLKVSPMKVLIRFGKKGKLNIRYVGPYEILG